MKVVVGLGNPGPEYEKTRHNVGFRVIGELALRHAAAGPKRKFDAELAEISLAGETVLLAAPQTYMNNSGRCVAQLVRFYQLPLTDLLVVCDDMNLETAKLRLRKAGSAGGQKGLQDIIHRLGTEEVPRLRIGIGRPPGRMDSSRYVLGKLRDDEAEQIQQAVLRAADGVEQWICEGIDAAMNRINAPPDSP